jgi:alpha-N-arabinofuranosidase
MVRSTIKDKICGKVLFLLIASAASLTVFGGCSGTQQKTTETKGSDSTTVVSISIPDHPPLIDTMIYGEMLEDCNDQIIYGGVVNKDGSERPAVNELIKPLRIPVVRWPGGTYSLEYHWENAVGPLDKRPVTEDYAWKGTDNNRFGTDEFIRWCQQMGAQPYINFNMGNIPPYGGTLKEALDWVEYVNGSVETVYGKKRAANGHKAPYDVKYWGIGNENYGPWGRHKKESDTAYADKLYQWAGAIRSSYSDLQLLAVGHTYNWDKTVLDKCGSLIDLLTQHYYVTSKLRDDKVETPERSLFAPAKMEAHLQRLGELVSQINQKLNREDHPIRLCVDEWDNRHNVYTGEKYEFTRQDARRQFDVAVVAGMLNVFIRQSPEVGMANYIFPVNGHGLIRSVGDTGAYRAAIYYVFEQYRRWMTGEKLDATVEGPRLSASAIEFYLDGDASEQDLGDAKLTYIDVSAVRGSNGTITAALVNRGADHARKVTVNVPADYAATTKWMLVSKDINAANTAEDRNNIKPVQQRVKRMKKSIQVTIPPCGLYLVRFEKDAAQ